MQWPCPPNTGNSTLPNMSPEKRIVGRVHFFSGETISRHSGGHLTMRLWNGGQSSAPPAGSDSTKLNGIQPWLVIPSPGEPILLSSVPCGERNTIQSWELHTMFPSEYPVWISDGEAVEQRGGKGLASLFNGLAGTTPNGRLSCFVCPSLSGPILLSLSLQQGQLAISRLNWWCTSPGGARVGESIKDWVLWLWSRGYIFSTESLTMLPPSRRTTNPVILNWPPHPTEIVPCGRGSGVQQAWVHSTVFLQKDLEEVHTTSQGGGVADRWTLTS